MIVLPLQAWIKKKTDVFYIVLQGKMAHILQMLQIPFYRMIGICL